MALDIGTTWGVFQSAGNLRGTEVLSGFNRAFVQDYTLRYLRNAIELLDRDARRPGNQSFLPEVAALSRTVNAMTASTDSAIMTSRQDFQSAVDRYHDLRRRMHWYASPPIDVAIPSIIDTNADTPSETGSLDDEARRALQLPPGDPLRIAITQWADWAHSIPENIAADRLLQPVLGESTLQIANRRKGRLAAWSHDRLDEVLRPAQPPPLAAARESDDMAWLLILAALAVWAKRKRRR